MNILDQQLALLESIEATVAAIKPVVATQPETISEGWIDSEAVEHAVKALKDGKTDAQTKTELLAAFDDIEQDADDFIKQAHVKVSDLLSAQETEIEAAQTAEDKAREMAGAAIDKQLDAELKYKKEYIEKRLNGSARKLSAEEINTVFVYEQDVEKREREWRTPKQLNSSPTVLGFDLSFLPTSLRDRVLDVSTRTSTPLDFAGIAAVTCLAGVIGRRAFVYPKSKDKEWKEAVALSGAIVAASGEVKTPVWKTFIDPIIENDADWRDEHKKEAKLHKIRLDSWEAAEKAAKASKTPFTTPRPEEPAKRRRCVINDATPEALHSAMQENPEGYLCYRDELSGFVEELDQEGRTSQRGIFMTAMDGDNNYTMERIGRGEVSARMCASVCGNFQPNRLEAFLSHARNIEDGLVPRFQLLIYPKTEYRPMVDSSVNDNAKNLYRRIVRELARLKVGAVQMHFAPDAQQVFIDWLEKMAQRIRSEESEWKKSHLSKYKGGLAKLAALFQMVDITAVAVQQVGAGSEISGTHLIDLAHLEQAMRFLDYLESHMHRIYSSVKSPLGKAEAVLADRIKDGSVRSGFTFRDIVRKGWRDLKAPDIIAEAIRSLEQAHWIRLMPKPVTTKGGQPAERWEINPLLFDVTAEPTVTS